MHCVMLHYIKGLNWLIKSRMQKMTCFEVQMSPLMRHIHEFSFIHSRSLSANTHLCPTIRTFTCIVLMILFGVIRQSLDVGQADFLFFSFFSL